MNEEHLGLLREKLRILQRELGWMLKNDMPCCGVTVAQCHALLEIGRGEEISLVELADLLGLDTSTLSRTVEGMVQEGLVERRNNRRDRRFISLTLTPRGRTVKREIDSTYNRFFTAVLEHIPPGKQDQVLESIHLLTDALSRNSRERVIGCCGEEAP